MASFDEKCTEISRAHQILCDQQSHLKSARPTARKALFRAAAELECCYADHDLFKYVVPSAYNLLTVLRREHSLPPSVEKEIQRAMAILGEIMRGELW